MTVSCRTVFFILRDDRLGCISGGWLVGWMQRFQEGDQGGHFGRIQVLPVSRHIASTLDDLAHQLIVGHAGGNSVEIRAA